MFDEITSMYRKGHIKSPDFARASHLLAHDDEALSPEELQEKRVLVEMLRAPPQPVVVNQHNHFINAGPGAAGAPPPPPHATKPQLSGTPSRGGAGGANDDDDDDDDEDSAENTLHNHATAHAQDPHTRRHMHGRTTYMAETVKLFSRIFSVSQSTFRRVLQKMTACVMVSVSYRSQSVSNFHSSFSTATKNCLMPVRSWCARACVRVCVCL